MIDGAKFDILHIAQFILSELITIIEIVLGTIRMLLRGNEVMGG